MGLRSPLSRDRIIAAALAVADAGGRQAVTLGAVARRLGVRVPVLSSSIDGIEDLNRRLTILALKTLAKQLQRATVGLTAGPALRAAAAVMRDLARERPGLYQYAVLDLKADDARVRRAAVAVANIWLDVLEAFGLEPDAAIHASRSFRAAVHGFVELERSGAFGLDVDADASFDWMVGVLVDGVARVGTARS